MTTGISVVIFYNFVWVTQDENTEQWLLTSGQLVYSLTRLTGVLTVLAFATKYLNHHSKKLTYLGDAVYPYYIVHQTIIIILGFELTQFSLGPIIEPILMIILTTVGCIASYELVKRIEIIRPFFGLKLQYAYNPKIKQLIYTLSALFIIPFAVEILI
ncbi:MAG: hypothetical protein HRT37_05200 [Alteromonadaceae bacterium]|nr:hypothetical protein [Alteromonadaceae bacterium]